MAPRRGKRVLSLRAHVDERTSKHTTGVSAVEMCGGRRNHWQMIDEPLEQLRRLCLGLPEAHEAEAWGAPTFRVKTIFAMYSTGDSRGETTGPSAWVKTSPPNQEFLVKAVPDRFFVPPYVGVKGWTGVRLSSDVVDWEELKGLIWNAWQMSVPKKLLAEHPEAPEEW